MSNEALDWIISLVAIGMMTLIAWGVYRLARRTGGEE